MLLGSLLSTQEARVALGDCYTSFVLSNLPRASTTPWLHAACLPFLKCLYENLISNYFRRTAFLKKIRTVNQSFTPKDSTEKNLGHFMG